MPLREGVQNSDIIGAVLRARESPAAPLPGHLPQALRWAIRQYVEGGPRSMIHDEERGAAYQWVQEVMSKARLPGRRFFTGKIQVSPSAARLMEQRAKRFSWDLAREEVMELIDRHGKGDWGVLDADRKGRNDTAVRLGMRVASRYAFDDALLWVITEWDRAVTKVLVESDILTATTGGNSDGN